MFKYMIAEINGLKKRLYEKIVDVTTARRERYSKNPLYREVEATRVRSNYIRIIPATVVLLLVEICGMLWAIVGKIKFDYGKGFLISSVIFVIVSFGFMCFLEAGLKRPFLSTRRQRNTYTAYWIVYMIEALSFSIMELLDRGTVNNYVTFIIAFTFLPVIEPIPKILIYAIAMGVEVYGILYTTQSIGTVIVCVALALAGVVCSAVNFFLYTSIQITNKRLEFTANGDALTGCMNRRGFRSGFPSLREFCRDRKKSLCMIMIDIDNFKKFNDIYGHIQGDICIKAVADCINHSFSRPTDMRVRYGGEEFLIVTAQSDVNALLEHLQKTLHDINNIKLDRVKEKVSVSMGLYICEDDKNKSPEEFIEKADTQLYNAKQNEKNCISFNNEIYR